MKIKDFELYHGVVLTKIARQDKNLTLRMIETQPKSAWALYRVDDKANLLIKHSKSPHSDDYGRKWQFTFSEGQMEQLDLGETSSSGTHVALVCGHGRPDGDQQPTGVCLLKPGELAELLEAGGTGQQAISVSLRKGESYRVRSYWQSGATKVRQNRLEKWP